MIFIAGVNCARSISAKRMSTWQRSMQDMGLPTATGDSPRAGHGIPIFTDMTGCLLADHSSVLSALASTLRITCMAAASSMAEASMDVAMGIAEGMDSTVLPADIVRRRLQARAFMAVDFKAVAAFTVVEEAEVTGKAVLAKGAQMT